MEKKETGGGEMYDPVGNLSVVGLYWQGCVACRCAERHDALELRDGDKLPWSFNTRKHW